MNKLVVISVLFIIVLYLGSCKDEAKKPINPNGDTEISLLMRAMYEEALTARRNIEKGEDFELSLDYKKLLTAKGVMTDKLESPLYKAYAESYIAIAERIKNDLSDNRIEDYKLLVEGCRKCHDVMCQGPLVLVNKLVLKE